MYRVSGKVLVITWLSSPYLRLRSFNRLTNYITKTIPRYSDLVCGQIAEFF
jgi:hypothetical protein